MTVVNTHMVYFHAFAPLKFFPTNARELGVGRGQIYAGINGLIVSVNSMG